MEWDGMVLEEKGYNGGTIRIYQMSHTSYISCESSLFDELEGSYEIHGFSLIPCQIREENQHSGKLNFIIKVPFNGYSTSNASFDLFRNSQIAIEEAKFFIAWLSTITRKYLDLSHREMGIASSVGPLMASKTSEKIADNQLEGIFHIKLGSENGAFYDVNRPDFSPPLMDEFHKLKMPSDINGYTDKLYNLPRRERDKFFDACFSYQFAQQNFRRTPSVSLVALVNCVEIMMRDEITSGYCKDAGKRCPAKKDVVAKFRKFFERNLVNPLPPERRKFLNSIYRSRSNFVHKALLGEGPLRGPKYMSFGKEDVIAEQLNELEILVNAGLISWLDNI